MSRVHWQQSVINDPIQRRRVAAVICGQELPGVVQLNQIVARENNVLTLLCEWMGVKYPGVEVVSYALHKAEAEWGGISIHDRVLPADLGLSQLFNGFYAFNAAKGEQREVPIKLGHPANGEWWRTDKGVQHLPTELSVIRQDLGAVMQPTDLLGRPFNLNLEEQMAWSKEQGGDGITSAKETVYLFLRSVYERGLPLWAAGSCRTRNTFGSANSLSVRWYAYDGFSVDYWNREHRDWDLGAFPRKSLSSDSFFKATKGSYLKDLIHPPSILPIS
jgi:hypothetical protein